MDAVLIVLPLWIIGYHINLLYSLTYMSPHNICTNALPCRPTVQYSDMVPFDIEIPRML